MGNKDKGSNIFADGREKTSELYESWDNILNPDQVEADQRGLSNATGGQAPHKDQMPGKDSEVQKGSHLNSRDRKALLGEIKKEIGQVNRALGTQRVQVTLSVGTNLKLAKVGLFTRYAKGEFVEKALAYAFANLESFIEEDDFR